jgi:hypothetical protein
VRLAEQFDVRVANFHEDATVAGIAAGIRRERSLSAIRVHHALLQSVAQIRAAARGAEAAVHMAASAG